MENSPYMVAIIGGAAAGAQTAGLLAERGVHSVVFEQNARPYGKIEDGLPRWHVKLRQKEYEVINGQLDRPEVHFVPLTKIGRDVDLAELANTWGFTAVILANGAWRDRPLPVDGADEYVGRGLIYQNQFIHWFNHCHEPNYRGPEYRIGDGAIVVGGGLASVDVAKVLQVETVRLALRERGIEEDMLHLEHAGVPAVLSEHGLSWETLGLTGATLFYRRRMADMPLTQIPPDADPERRRKSEATRQRILEKAMKKYLFGVKPQHVPVGLIVEGDRLAGLRFRRTRIDGGRAVPIEGETEDIRAPMIISSIGSVPEPIPGVPQRGEFYDYADPDLGRFDAYDNVFSTGNVVTGKGNIAASRKHSLRVAADVIEDFLGLAANGHEGEEAALEALTTDVEETANSVAAWVGKRPPLDGPRINALMRRVRERQEAVGYRGSYQEWIRRFTPLPDASRSVG